jgi:hypothetical protein
MRRGAGGLLRPCVLDGCSWMPGGRASGVGCESNVRCYRGVESGILPVSGEDSGRDWLSDGCPRPLAYCRKASATNVLFRSVAQDAIMHIAHSAV